MGLFDYFNNNKDIIDHYSIFSNWLDQVLEQKQPSEIQAYHFNIYEGKKENYNIQ